MTYLERYLQDGAIVVPGEEHRCVDGRYDPDQAGRAFAYPGASLGTALALMRIGTVKKWELTAEDYFTATGKAYSDLGCYMYLHTDDGGHGFGCGHVARAASKRYAVYYGVSVELVANLIRVAEQQAGMFPDKVKMVTLAGYHAEQAVLVNLDERHTILPYLGNRMFFVYDQGLHTQFLRKLIPKLQQYVPSFTKEEFQTAVDQQLGATLSILAEGLPLYEVSFPDGIEKPVRIVPKLFVPPLAELAETVTV